MTNTLSLQTSETTLVYDVRGPLPPADGRPPLLLVGAPMDAGGFATLASYFSDRTVVTYDPRGLGRSTRHDGRTEHTPEQNADDIHRIIEALDVGPVEMFASSGGAVSALALVAAHPGDVTKLVAHEPPLLGTLPDADQAFADDGSREDPLLSGASDAISAYRPDFHALASAPTRVVIAVGTESQGVLTGRTSVATAQALGQEATVFPSHHGGFMGGEVGYAGEPEAFAARLHEVLDGG
jgi:pimeloyl-ACP methyl ester carboxylesterase